MPLDFVTAAMRELWHVAAGLSLYAPALRQGTAEAYPAPAARLKNHTLSTFNESGIEPIYNATTMTRTGGSAMPV